MHGLSIITGLDYRTGILESPNLVNIAYLQYGNMQVYESSVACKDAIK